MKQEHIELKPSKGHTFKPYELKDTMVEFKVEYRDRTLTYEISLADIVNNISNDLKTIKF